ncbi:(2Fe-2S)-binding protein [Bordetella avium]|uniref:(2Fe-2S)-binding protein n=1 Tax=Bordetella avium TaxID=521 RepID=UPI000E6A1741|nr:(2Fe-2S)-binding protein [Bordetella avium]RIQ17425.1 (2Fe-2S)-binding protein [Bordetella avium]RIQ33912.1 (2Fe-2S)-binding protein [Bordetella avium]
MGRSTSSGSRPITLHINGSNLTACAEPRVNLADFMRQELCLTGTHVGCEHGVCGACTVQVDGHSMRSCLMLAVQAQGKRIHTIEGLADEQGNLHPVQEAFRELHALQCGFCTPGILMSVVELLESNTDPSEAEIRDVLSGHLCRCTGYQNIVRAVQKAAAVMRACHGHQ